VQGKWLALQEAADAYSELAGYACKERQWVLQRVRLCRPCTMTSSRNKIGNGLQGPGGVTPEKRKCAAMDKEALSLEKAVEAT